MPFKLTPLRDTGMDMARYLATPPLLAGAKPPPKISVIVRKRPLNAQVRSSTECIVPDRLSCLVVALMAARVAGCGLSNNVCINQESDRGEFDVIQVDMDACQLIVNEPKVKVDLKQYTERHTFNFDAVFGEDVDNEIVYRRVLVCVA